MNNNYDRYLVEVLNAELASKESELESLRDSLRYRLGGWMLEAFPLGVNTIVILFRLIGAYFKRRNNHAVKVSVHSVRALNDIARKARLIVFGDSMPSGFDKEMVWQTSDAELLAKRLDILDNVSTLVIRSPSHQILRRLSRLRYCGWRTIWCPESEEAIADPALHAYAISHVDELWDNH